MRGQMREIRNPTERVADLRAEMPHLLVGQLQEFVKESELVHELEGRRVDGVPAEIAEEIGVLLEDDDVQACAGEQEAEHHAGRAAARNATSGAEILRHPDVAASSTHALFAA